MLHVVVMCIGMVGLDVVKVVTLLLMSYVT